MLLGLNNYLHGT